MPWIANLFSSDDSAVDSVIWSTVVGVLGLLALAFYQSIAHGTPVGITETGTGISAVIAAGGAVRVGRERFKAAPPTTTS
jgi:hypothetical protein